MPGAQDLESVWKEWSTQPHSVPRDHVRCVARWIAEVAEAVAEAHSCGVLHRDLKPANLLLDGEGRVRLVDFGLASIRDRVGLSRTGKMSGTPYYMCPEQVRRGSFSRIEALHPTEGLQALASPVTGEVEIQGSTGTAVLLELGQLGSELLDLSFVPGADGLVAISSDGSLHFWGTSLSHWPLRYD